MTLMQVIFYGFSALLIGSSLMVISARNSVHAVMFLVLSFFSAAGIWMMLEVEFLALLLILVYVGAVMVLFLFVVMMLDVDFAALKSGFTRYLPIGIVIAVGLLYMVFRLVGTDAFGPENFPIPAPRAEDYSSVKELGMLMYTEYFYAFEIAALILMVAMIAAISLAFRGKKPGTKTQQIDKQVRVKKADRLRVIKVEAHKQQSGDNSEGAKS